MPDRKQVNFTIVPDEPSDVPRTYANFCSISHTPFDFTLTFCEVLPPNEQDVRTAETEQQANLWIGLLFGSEFLRAIWIRTTGPIDSVSFRR